METKQRSESEKDSPNDGVEVECKQQKCLVSVAVGSQLASQSASQCTSRQIYGASHGAV